jgi:uncharacterized protein with predicted RNA binding PUA domain
LLKKLYVNPLEKILSSVDFIFGYGVSQVLPSNLEIEFSRRTGKVKSFSFEKNLIGTFRSDGGIALTIYGANLFLKSNVYRNNCIIPIDDAIPFVSEGRSLFVKHVDTCGSNVKCGSDVAIVDKQVKVLAVGRALLSTSYFLQLERENLGTNVDNSPSHVRGIAVKVREGIKSRTS